MFMQLFEGMKAFHGADGKARLFRPLENMKRLNRSAVAMSLPVSDCVGFSAQLLVFMAYTSHMCCVHCKYVAAYCCVTYMFSDCRVVPHVCCEELLDMHMYQLCYVACTGPKRVCNVWAW